MKANGFATQVEDGEAVITGLNILMAISVHPSAKEAMFEIMVTTSIGAGVPMQKLFDAVEQAADFIDGANDQIRELGIIPVVSQVRKKPNPKTNQNPASEEGDEKL